MLLRGDCLASMRSMPDDSVDLIVTDPPYGYSFMGKDWDRAVPSVDIWREALRVLKPGAFAFVMSAPRLDVQSEMARRLADAGFRIDFTPLYWTYASGFPKAQNIGKAVDKQLGAEREVVGKTRGGVEPGGKYGESRLSEADKWHDVTAPATPQAKALDGSYAGYQPKPAVEVCMVAMKPLSERTYVAQALANGKGVTWLDDVRVPVADRSEYQHNCAGDRGQLGDTRNVYGSGFVSGSASSQGRFPANLLVSDDVLNDGVERRVGSGSKDPTPSAGGANCYGWAKSSKLHKTGDHYGDSGSYSRYFDLDAWASTLPFLIVPKASKREKDAGCEGFAIKPTSGRRGGSDYTAGGVNKGATSQPRRNHHPTVKPVKLMSYLITLGSRPGDTVLDPFTGSGTTGVAAKQLGRDFIGCELSDEYADIAEARIAHAEAPQPTLLDEVSA